jgi:hypothetical protein
MPNPDEGLAAENFPELNAGFYRMSPHGYLRMRLRNLYLWMGNPVGMYGLLGEGVKFDEMAISQSGEPDEEDEEERQRFAAIEAEVLLHHASETLLRLYLVHAQLPPCPWLELSRERDFKKFKKEVGKLQDRLPSGEESDRIHHVFHVNSERTAIKPTPDAEIWDRAAENIARFLAFYASHFLDSSSYNAAKHGLALTAGEQGFALGAGQDKEPFLSRRGPAIEYLKVNRSADNRPRWSREVKWIVAKRAVPLIYMGCNLIEGIWNVAASRYGVRELKELKLFDHPPFEEVMKRSEDRGEGIEGIVMDGFSQTLLYYGDEEDD